MTVKTTVLNYHHKPVPHDALWIGRPNKWHPGAIFGNPHTLARLGPCETCTRKFKIVTKHEPDECKALYLAYFYERIAQDAEFRMCVMKLRGRKLLCGCVKKDGSGWCHGKTIAEFLDSLPLPATEEEVIGAARSELAKLAAKAVEEADAPSA